MSFEGSIKTLRFSLGGGADYRYFASGGVGLDDYGTWEDPYMVDSRNVKWAIEKAKSECVPFIATQDIYTSYIYNGGLMIAFETGSGTGNDGSGVVLSPMDMTITSPKIIINGLIKAASSGLAIKTDYLTWEDTPDDVHDYNYFRILRGSESLELIYSMRVESNDQTIPLIRIKTDVPTKIPTTSFGGIVEVANLKLTSSNTTFSSLASADDPSNWTDNQLVDAKTVYDGVQKMFKEFADRNGLVIPESWNQP
jgi:hypothetical protein